MMQLMQMMQQNESIWKTILGAICASIAIGIGCIAYLTTGQAWTFSIGLLIISLLSLNLFTGKIPYATFKTIPMLIVILIFNMLAAYGFGALMHYIYPNLVQYGWPVVAAKMTEGWTVIPRAILCNALIFIAVHAWNHLSSPANLLILCFATTLFVICGFEHCVANAFYFGFTLTTGWNVLSYLGLNILGNTIGGIAAYHTAKAVQPQFKRLKELTEQKK